MAFAHPESVIAQLGNIEGLSVADFGAGVGAYAVALGKKVGDEGKVYAIEIQKDFLSKIRNAALSLRLTNVEVLWGDVERLGASKLKDSSVDIVVAANVFFQIEDKAGFVAEVKRVLVPGGRVLFVDWSDSFGGLGPERSVVVRPDDSRNYFEEEDFVFVSRIEAGEHHYGFVMKK
jgi:ubiquinone/menaquinone biosynthesis C-methylase UbiE